MATPGLTGYWKLQNILHLLQALKNFVEIAP